VETASHKNAEIPWKTIQNFPVPVLIANFLVQFQLKK